MAKRLEVGVSVGSCQNRDYIDLPDDWEEMSQEDRDEFIRQSVNTHIENHVDAWGTIVEASDQ